VQLLTLRALLGEDRRLALVAGEVRVLMLLECCEESCEALFELSKSEACGEQGDTGSSTRCVGEAAAATAGGAARAAVAVI
jgi:hypothetical protein